MSAYDRVENTDEDGETRVLEKTLSCLSVGKSREKSKWILSPKEIQSEKKPTLASGSIPSYQHGLSSIICLQNDPHQDLVREPW